MKKSLLAKRLMREPDESREEDDSRRKIKATYNIDSTVEVGV